MKRPLLIYFTYKTFCLEPDFLIETIHITDFTYIFKLVLTKNKFSFESFKIASFYCDVAKPIFKMSSIYQANLDPPQTFFPFLKKVKGKFNVV